MEFRARTEQAMNEPTIMMPHQHAIRIGLLMAATALLMSWALRHTEASFADGLRYIRQAEQIDRGAWRDGLIGSIDHPLHPLGIVMAHGLVGGEGPVAWQRAAVALAFGCIVLLVIPLYLLTRDAFGDETAWLGCILVLANPLMGSIVANVLSESSFLLFWTWGLWAAIRFLREGRFLWLPLTIGFGVLAYLSRPEGLLLPLAMVATLGILPLHRATWINWPRWRAAVAFLVLGSFVLAGPYMALKGGVGTKPAIARVLGLAPMSPPNALERDRPLPADQTALETYRLATERLFKVLRGVVSTPLLPLAALGLLMLRPGPARARTWLFFAVILLASGIGLVRLHATGGYCTARHGLIPGVILILAAAHGLTWLMERVSISGKWFGMAQERLLPGPAIWAIVLTLLVVIPRCRDSGPPTLDPFLVYRDTGAWLAQNTRNNDQILDLTDWSLYFSRRPGYRFAHVYQAPADPQTRWVVVRKPHLDGHWNYTKVVRELVGDRDPVALVPANPRSGQLQIRIYDRFSPTGRVAAGRYSDVEQATRR
jgi:4-amino-4-deoxy-L-arabinose transferase-like glycosyltransferase